MRAAAVAGLLLVLLGGCGPGREREKAAELLEAGRVEEAGRLARRLARWYPRDTAVLSLAVAVAAAQRQLVTATDAYRRYFVGGKKHSRDLLAVLLLAAFSDPDEDVVTSAVRASGELALDTTFKAVRKATWDGNPRIRGEAYMAFARFRKRDTAFGGKYAVGWMWAGYIEEPDPYVRAAIINATALVGDSSTVGVTRIGQLEQNDFVIWQFFKMRAELGDREMARRVREELNGEYGILRTEAAASLVRQGERQYLHLVARGLASPEPMTRAAAAVGLGDVHADEHLDALVAAAADSSGGVRFRVAYALGELGGERGVPAVIRLLADTSEIVRNEAAVALAKLRPTDAEQLLFALMADSCLSVRIGATAALLALQAR